MDDYMGPIGSPIPQEHVGRLETFSTSLIRSENIIYRHRVCRSKNFYALESANG